MRGFTTLPPHLRPMASWMSPADLASRSRAAAVMAFKGKAYGPEDVADAAAHIVAAVTGAAHAERRGRPADVLAWMDYAERYPTLARRYADGVPHESATMTRLYGLASNLRRTLDRDRVRDAADIAERDRRGGFHAGTPGAAPPSPAPLDAASAHETARDLLGGLGLARLGKLYPVAYAAARDGHGSTAEEIAAELAMTPGNLRVHLNRSAKKVPSAQLFSPAAHAEALSVDIYWTPSGKSGAEALPAEDRYRAGDRTPNTATTVPAAPVTVRRVKPTRKPWTGKRHAAWVEYLTPNTAARLDAAARISRERSAARTSAERSAILTAHGIPA